MAWYDERVRSRARAQYTFRRRNDRRWIAKRLAAGMSAVEVAAVERTTPEQIEGLLGEQSFRRLVAHYEALGRLDPETRMRRLMALAVDLLEIAMEEGDIRVAAFLVEEGRAGRQPAETIARGIVRGLEKVIARGERRGRYRPPRGPNEPGWNVWQLPAFGGSAAAVDYAKVELGRAPERLVHIRSTLRRQITIELERMGTAGVQPMAPSKCPSSCSGLSEGVMAAAAQGGADAVVNVQAVGAPAAPGDRCGDGVDMPPPAAQPTRSEPVERQLPDWLDRVDYRVRLHAERLPDHELAPYLRCIAGFYGFDTS
jgi:hypothetical protein